MFHSGTATETRWAVSASGGPFLTKRDLRSPYKTRTGHLSAVCFSTQSFERLPGACTYLKQKRVAAAASALNEPGRSCCSFQKVTNCATFAGAPYKAPFSQACPTGYRLPVTGFQLAQLAEASQSFANGPGAEPFLRNSARTTSISVWPGNT